MICQQTKRFIEFWALIVRNKIYTFQEALGNINACYFSCSVVFSLAFFTCFFDHGVKYTVILPEDDVKKLRSLARSNTIDSINSGVREAVAQYITKLNNITYEKDLMEAVNDPEFIKRNKVIEESFKHSDKEIEELHSEW